MWSAIFAGIDPAGALHDLRRVFERRFDLRSGTGSVWFEPRKPEKYRTQSYATRALWDPATASYIQVHVYFPSLYSDATVANGVGGLNIYSQPDEPAPF